MLLLINKLIISKVKDLKFLLIYLKASVMFEELKLSGLKICTRLCLLYCGAYQGEIPYTFVAISGTVFIPGKPGLGKVNFSKTSVCWRRGYVTSNASVDRSHDRVPLWIWNQNILHLTPWAWDLDTLHPSFRTWNLVTLSLPATDTWGRHPTRPPALTPSDEHRNT